MQAAGANGSESGEIFITKVLYMKVKQSGSMPLAAMIKGREREDLAGFIRYLKR